jgi:hypothetical protein
MAPSTNLYAALAGYVGRPDQTGRTGVFRRDAVAGEWQHVLLDLEAFTVVVNPRQPALVLAGTADGVWRSEDRGATFARGFPGQRQADLVVPRRREQSGSRLSEQFQSKPALRIRARSENELSSLCEGAHPASSQSRMKCSNDLTFFGICCRSELGGNFGTIMPAASRHVRAPY